MAGLGNFAELLGMKSGNMEAAKLPLMFWRRMSASGGGGLGPYCFASRLVPSTTSVVFLADRKRAHTSLSRLREALVTQTQDGWKKRGFVGRYWVRSSDSACIIAIQPYQTKTGGEAVQRSLVQTAMTIHSHDGVEDW